jgi:hypothetical protein
MLTFKVANFDMGYNCILERTLLIKFIMVIHTDYVVMKLPGVLALSGSMEIIL